MKSVIVVLCHGTWGKYLVDDLKKYFGTSVEFKLFPLLKNQAKEAYQQDIEEQIRVYDQIIFVSDLYGSTTFRVGLILALKFEMLSYTNLSLELLLKCSDVIEAELSQAEIREELMLNCNHEFEELVEKYKQEFGGN